MAQAALQIGLDARQVFEIHRFAVTPIQPHENAEDLGGPLCAQNGIGRGEPGHVEIRVAPLAAQGIARQQLEFERLRDLHARILRERDHIIGRMANHAVLIIDEADAA